MMLGETACGNPRIGHSGIAMTAAAYYFTARTAWATMRFADAQIKNGNSNVSIELAHGTTAITNMFFACELAIKSLLSESDRAKTHKLNELFQKLKQEDKDAINERLIGTKYISDETDFMHFLNRCSNNFAAWRYFFESSNGTLFGNFNLTKVMVEEVLDMYGIDY